MLAQATQEPLLLQASITPHRRIQHSLGTERVAACILEAGAQTSRTDGHWGNVFVIGWIWGVLPDDPAQQKGFLYIVCGH